MRRLDAYTRKYGDEYGRLLYRTLQRETAQARWKAFYRDRVEGDASGDRADVVGDSGSS